MKKYWLKKKQDDFTKAEQTFVNKMRKLGAEYVVRDTDQDKDKQLKAVFVCPHCYLDADPLALVIWIDGFIDLSSAMINHDLDIDEDFDTGIGMYKTEVEWLANTLMDLQFSTLKLKDHKSHRYETAQMLKEVDGD